MVSWILHQWLFACWSCQRCWCQGCLRYLFHPFSCQAVSFPEHSQVWSHWKHCLCPTAFGLWCFYWTCNCIGQPRVQKEHRVLSSFHGFPAAWVIVKNLACPVHAHINFLLSWIISGFFIVSPFWFFFSVSTNFAVEISFMFLSSCHTCTRTWPLQQ